MWCVCAGGRGEGVLSTLHNADIQLPLCMAHMYLFVVIEEECYGS